MDEAHALDRCDVTMPRRRSSVRFALPGDEPEVLDVSEMVESGAAFLVGSRLSIVLGGHETVYSIFRTEHTEVIEHDGAVLSKWLIFLDFDRSPDRLYVSIPVTLKTPSRTRSTGSCRRRMV